MSLAMTRSTKSLQQYQEAHRAGWGKPQQGNPADILQPPLIFSLSAKYQMKYWGHLLLFLLITGCSIATDKQIITRVSPEPKHHAWWLRIEFVPVHKEIRGVPVRQIDPSWRFASELRKEAIPPELLLEGGT